MKELSTTLSHYSRLLATVLLIFFSPGLQKVLACGPNDPACQDNLACNDQINVTLNDDCAALITPDMVLEGNFGCLEDFKRYFKMRIVGDDPNEANEGYGETTVNSCGRFIYEIIFDHEGFCSDGHQLKVNFPLEGCWGYIKAEDKTPPAFVCQEEVIEKLEVNVQAQKNTGNTGAPAINFGNYSCFRDVGVSANNCQRGYKLINNVSSNKDAVYTFYLEMPGAPGSLAIYQDSFDPASPCSNIVAQSSTTYLGTSTLSNGLIRLSLPMKATAKYTILVTTYDNACSSNQPYELYAYSDNSTAKLENFGPVANKKVIYPLLCSDINLILNSDALIPGPAIREACTVCGPVNKWFVDVLTKEGDCGGSFITRTWYVRDAAGNQSTATCRQIIKFRTTRLTDVVRPPTTVPIECDEDFPLDANGNPHPDFTGYPFVATTTGIVDLNDSYCNVGATYRDISKIETCAGAYKIVREWTIIDWCYIPGQYDLNNSPLINYRQVIKVGDFSGPGFNNLPADGLVMPTGPFSCEAAFSIPNVGVADNCSGFTVKAKVYLAVKKPVYDKYGNLINEVYEYVFKVEKPMGGYVTGIPVNDPGYPHKIVYQADDGCGNSSETEIFFEVKDRIEPVAVCNDNLNISIGGEGIGRVRATDVNEGSWDNCALASLLISRKLVNNDRRDAYLQQVYGLSFSQLQKSSNVDPSGQASEIWVLKSDQKTEVLRFKNNMWFTWWKDDVWFICLDMGENVTIELVAIDASGNANVCWMDVLVEDKIAPYCQAPANVSIACTELPYGFDPQDDAQLATLFGNATATDNCPGVITEQLSKTVNKWECNAGSITRYFGAKDAKGRTSSNTCQQEITVYKVHDYVIEFPADQEFYCTAASPDTLIELTERACDLLSLHVRDERFTASGDACYKIQRTFKIINWCQYDGESDPMIIGRDEDQNGVAGDKNVFVVYTKETRNVEGKGQYFTYVDANDNPFTQPPANLHYHRTGFDKGYYQYTQFIKVIDNTAPVVVAGATEPFCSYNNQDCAADAFIPVNISDACAGSDINIKVFLLPDPATGLPSKLDLQIPANAAAVKFNISGSYPDYSFNGRYPLGNHQLEVHVVDGCQNSTLEKIPFRIIDCKAPAPICINGLAVELMPTEPGTDADGDGDEDAGAMAIWASDFKVSNLTDCSGPVKLSINRVGEKPNVNQTSLVLTCDDPDTLKVEIYAWDSANNPTAVQPDGSLGGPNYDHCLTYVIIQDNMFNLCNPTGPAAISGLIVNEENQTLEKVQVNLTGGMDYTMMTPVNGFYTFSDLISNNDYTVTPQKDDDYTNGVSTYDIVLITKHILGTNKFNNPYKLIAADINKSGSVTALDLIQLRKLVLSVYRKFPSNTSWRFVPASYRFPDATNPWKESFPEIMNFNDLHESITSGDFIAIKIGDLNGNARANSLVTEQRSFSGVFQLQLEDQTLQAGQEYRIPFTAEKMADLQGYQFTLNYTGLEVVEIDYGIAQAEHFGFIEEGVITTSWNSTTPSLEPSAILFTLIVRAKDNARLSDLLRINSRYTAAEAYDNADETMGVALAFTDEKKLPNAFHLDQNQPNPFAAETVIGFYLPEAARAGIRIHDLTGRTLKLIRGDYAQGYNQVRLRSTDLTPGVLYYTLETDNFTATKKMVLIE